ncbi:hypothetical protein Sango_2900200 [Sesamum angolense]|uniref:Uncharacterized protein n=1 Tax=Sesamum angolense TaxID=2727404 RepID=A0AAE1VW14_9LAMI|nr:hypothetical protein Sango_2900200 [Sesamum angolense]
MMYNEVKERHEIALSSQDLGSDILANNDAVVIFATISKIWVKKVLVDSGSLANIIFYKALSQMGICNAQLSQVNTLLTNFSGDIVKPLGEVVLPISLGSYPGRAKVTHLDLESVADANVDQNLVEAPGLDQKHDQRQHFPLCQQPPTLSFL